MSASSIGRRALSSGLPSKPARRVTVQEGWGRSRSLDASGRDSRSRRPRSEVAGITRSIESGYPLNFNQFVVNLSSLQEDNTRTVRSTLLTVSAAVICLLLIAAMNVGALTLGRGIGRMREAAIRAALGSGALGCSGSSSLKACSSPSSAGPCGVALAMMATRLFIGWNPLGTLPANAIQLDLRVLGIAGAAMLATTVICGLVPALRVSAADPHDALGAGGERGSVTRPERTGADSAARGPDGDVDRRARGRDAADTNVHAASYTSHSGSMPRTSGSPRSPCRRIPSTPLTSATPSIANWTNASARSRACRRSLRVRRRRSTAARQSPSTLGPMIRRALLASTPRMWRRVVLCRAGHSASCRPSTSTRASRGRGAGRDRQRPARHNRSSADRRPPSAQRVRLGSGPWREIVGVVGNVRSSFFNTLEWRTDPILYRPASQVFASVDDPSAASFGLSLLVRSESSSFAGRGSRGVPLDQFACARVTDHTARVRMPIGVATRQPALRMRLLFALFAGQPAAGRDRCLRHRLAGGRVSPSRGRDPGSCGCGPD